MPKENKMIRALSLDFDGSFGGGKRDFRPRGNETFHDYLAIKNQKLLNEINAETKNGTEVIVMVGSNRQSVESENSATPLRNKWCAPVLNAVITSIKEPTIRFDGFLLGDVYRKDQTQESEFDRIQKFASDRTKTIEKNDPVPVDKTKLSILYAQMHKIASENPEATIVFDFYDDKTEILDSLNTFLTKNPDLIPKNVTLQLHRYVSFDDKTNEKLEEHCEDTTYETKKIQGEGPIDAFYIENTKRLTDIGYEGYQPAADKHPDLINALNLAPEKLSLFKKEKKGLWKGENYDLFKKDLLFYCQEEKKGSNLLLVEMDFSRGLWPSDLSDKEIKINDENPYGYKINGHQILLNENMTENERYEAVLIKIWAGLLNIEVNAKNTEELKKIYLSAKKGVEEHHKRKQKTTPFQIKGPIAYKKLQKIGLMHRQDVPSPLTNFFVRKQVSLDGNKIAGGRKDFIDIKRNGETVAITTLLDGSVKYSVTANIVLQAEDSSIMPGIPLGPISYAIIAKADGSFEIEHDAFHIKSKALCDYLSGNQSDLENPTRQCLFLKECIEEAKEHYPQWEKSDLHDNLLIKHTKAHRQEITPLKEWVKEAERRKLAFKEATYDKRQETFDHYYNEVNVHPVPKDYTNLNLSDIDLSDKDLSETDLRNTKIDNTTKINEKTDFSGCKLTFNQIKTLSKQCSFSLSGNTHNRENCDQNPVSWLVGSELSAAKSLTALLLLSNFIEEYTRLYNGGNNFLESDSFKNQTIEVQVKAIIDQIEKHPGKKTNQAFFHALYKTTKQLRPDETLLHQNLSNALKIVDASLALKENSLNISSRKPNEETKISLKGYALKKINEQAKEKITGENGFALFIGDLTRNNFAAGNVRFYDFLAGLGTIDVFIKTIGKEIWSKFNESTKRKIIAAFASEKNEKPNQLQAVISGIASQHNGENIRALIYSWLKKAFPTLSEKNDSELDTLIKPWYSPWSQDMAGPSSKLITTEETETDSHGKLKMTRTPFAEYCITQAATTIPHSPISIPFFRLKAEGDFRLHYDGEKIIGESTDLLTISITDKSLCDAMEISWPIGQVDFSSERLKKQGPHNEYHFSITSASCYSDNLASLLSEPRSLKKEDYPHFIYKELRRSLINDTAKKKIPNKEKNIIEEQSLSTSEKIALLLLTAKKLDIPANLLGFDLQGENLCDEDLRGADLRGTDLRGADLNEAILDDRTRLSRQQLESANWDSYKHQILDPKNGDLLAEVIVNRKKFKNHYKSEDFKTMMFDLYRKQIEKTLRVCRIDEKEVLLEKYRRLCEILNKPHDLSSFDLSGNFALTISDETKLPENVDSFSGRLTYEYYATHTDTTPILVDLSSEKLILEINKRDIKRATSESGSISTNFEYTIDTARDRDFSCILQKTFQERQLYLLRQQEHKPLIRISKIMHKGTKEEKAALDYAKYETLRQHFLACKDKAISLEELETLIDMATRAGVQIKTAVKDLKLHDGEEYNYIDINNKPRKINVKEIWDKVTFKINEINIPKKWAHEKPSLIEVFAEAHVSPKVKKALHRELTNPVHTKKPTLEKTISPALPESASQQALNHTEFLTVLSHLLVEQKGFAKIIPVSDTPTTQPKKQQDSSNVPEVADDPLTSNDTSSNGFVVDMDSEALTRDLEAVNLQPYECYYSYNRATDTVTVVYTDMNAIREHLVKNSPDDRTQRFKNTAEKIRALHPHANIQHILPEEGYGQFGALKPDNRHIRLSIIDQPANKPFNDCYSSKKTFDPRDLAFHAQSRFDDVNCGRHVLAMTMQAAGLSIHAYTINHDNLNASPAIKNAYHFRTLNELKKGLSNTYVPPLSNYEVDLKEKIAHYQAVIRSLAAEYGARTGTREFHGTTLFGKYLASLFSGGFTGFSASEKIKAIKEIEPLLQPGTTDLKIEFDTLPKAARQGRLGDAVKALIEAKNELSLQLRNKFTH